jgi:diketogulonate reductase-like aldo/keto reductase
MRTVRTRTGAEVPALGQGTWNMGKKPACRRWEANALRTGLDLGMTLIDTAEMCGNGGAEEVVADALEETLAAFEQLREEGKILHYGLSNFDTKEMEAPGAREIADPVVQCPRYRYHGLFPTR